MTTPKFYTIKEVAEIFNISEATVNRRIKDGSIKIMQLSPGGAVRISAAEIERLGLPEVEIEDGK